MRTPLSVTIARSLRAVHLVPVRCYGAAVALVLGIGLGLHAGDALAQKRSQGSGMTPAYAPATASFPSSASQSGDAVTQAPQPGAAGASSTPGASTLAPIDSPESEVPVRRPGLWQITMQIAGAQPQSVRHCVDARTDLPMQLLGHDDARACSRRTMRRDGDRYLGEFECALGASTTRTRTSFEGDFKTAYRGQIDSRVEPPMAGVTQSRVSITARWSGACPTGWKPGDMDVAGMGRVNIADMQSMRAQKSK
jgi:hypothetical protein